MSIKYRFKLDVEDEVSDVHPLYKDDLSKEYEMQSQQRFYRANLSGTLKFIGSEFEYLKSKAFDTLFLLTIQKSNDNGQTWVDYWKGKFTKADGKWDEDGRVVTVKVETLDEYTNLMKGIDKEYNLVKLLPSIEGVKLDKRPLIQIYTPGENVVGCFLGGNFWEQEVTSPISDLSELTGTYHFGNAGTFTEIDLTGATTPSDSNGKYYEISDKPAGVYQYYVHNTNGYEIRAYDVINGGIHELDYELIRISDEVVLFRAEDQPFNFTPGSYSIPFNSVSGESSGSPDGAIEIGAIYAREVSDVLTLPGGPTYEIPSPDLVADNRNYHRVSNRFSVDVQLSLATSPNPTEFGKSENGEYFEEYTEGGKHFPVARSTWGRVSKWVIAGAISPSDEIAGRKEYTLRDGIPLSEAIKVLVKEIDPNLTHEGTELYSEFLYAGSTLILDDIATVPTPNPISGDIFRLGITPKSNILYGDYDRPAGKAPITLQSIMAMLRDTFQLYWFIENDKFKIEHISWFKNGGSYTGSPSIGADLTSLSDIKNKKSWGFAADKFEFDKQDIPERIEFKWMDDCTQAFEGYPIEMRSNYVHDGKVDPVNVGDFTSDIDYMLLNPTDVNPDGFALMTTDLDNNLIYKDISVDNVSLSLQNGIVSWLYLAPSFWRHDLPCRNVLMNNADTPISVLGVSRKKKQQVKYPSPEDPNPLLLVKTQLGEGEIQKINVNLSSRMNEIQLRYDTE